MSTSKTNEGSGEYHIIDDDKPVEKPKFNAEKATPEELMKELEQRVRDTFNVPPPSIKFVPASEAQEGKPAQPAMFVVLMRKDHMKPENLAKLGFDQKSKTGSKKVENWSVSKTILKSRFGGKEDAGELGSKLRGVELKGSNGKPRNFTGLEFAMVTDNLEKGFTISNVVGTSRSELFGKEDGASVTKDDSQANAALVVTEAELRRALSDKKAETAKSQTAASSAPLAPEINFSDLAALAAEERNAPPSGLPGEAPPAVQEALENPAAPPTPKKRGWFGRG